MERARSATWESYYQNTKDYPPRPLLVKGLDFVKQRDNALDLGAGALNDSKYLLSQGFENVTAVDKFEVAVQDAENIPKDHFKHVISSFEEYDFPKDKFDLVNAQFALPFVNPSNFDSVFQNIFNSLKNGGILTGQFFGDRDEWKKLPGMTFLTKSQAVEYLNTLKIIFFEEDERDKKNASGEMKHWHIFHFIAEKE